MKCLRTDKAIVESFWLECHPTEKYIMGQKRLLNESFFITSHGVRLNYVTSGPERGTAIVFIPAQSTTWSSYKSVLRILSQHTQVFANGQQSIFSRISGSCLCRGSYNGKILCMEMK